MLACRSSVDCCESGRSALKAGGITVPVAKMLVDQLGYSEAGDLVHITQVGSLCAPSLEAIQ